MSKEYKLDKNLKFLLKDCHMTQRELSKEICTSAENINKWMNNKGYPSMLSLLQLADFFCVSLDELVYGEIE